MRTVGVMEPLYPKDGQKFTLEELQKAVGGTIDIQYMPTGEIMVVNDNGKLEGLPINQVATEIWKSAYPIEQYPHNNDELIVGDVLFFDIEDRDEILDHDESEV